MLSSPSRLEAWRSEKRAIKVALYVHPISIEFKQSTYIKASYRVKRTLIHVFCGHVLELIAAGIFYGFLNTVEPLGTDTFLIRTPLYYGQFPMSRQNSHLFSLKKTSIIRTFSNTDNRH